LIVRHNVVALAKQARQMLASADAAAVDRAAIQTDMSALGRFLVTKKESDIAAFKTPNLRNLLLTAPYFHDGSQATLWDVIDHYNKGAGLNNPYLDEDIVPLALDEGDIDDLVAFMASLTSPPCKEAAAVELARQCELSRTSRPQRDHGPRVWSRASAEKKPPHRSVQAGGPGPTRASPGRTEHVRPCESARSPRDTDRRDRAR
jgi:cytochrome c peroxidase